MISIKDILPDLEDRNLVRSIISLFNGTLQSVIDKKTGEIIYSIDR